MQNKPNSSIADCGLRIQKGLRLTARAGPIVQNEPNSGPAGGRDTPSFQHSSIPPFQSVAIVRNEPNLGRFGQGPDARKMRNEPNLLDRLGPRRAKCAKRTQFRPLRPSRAPLFQYSIIPAFQSDANRAKRTQFPAGGKGAVTAEPDRAKQSQFPPAGTRLGSRGSPLAPLVSRSIVRNKPNSGSGGEEASALWGGSYGGSNIL